MSLVRGTTVSEVLREATERLAAAGCETPRLDAEVLLAFVLGWTRAALVMRAASPQDAPEIDAFHRAVERRIAREPVAYITGKRAFRHIELAVDPRVLIPRPETELLVEVGLRLAPGARVVDVGTGSGAVALALKQERPDLVVSGVDSSAEALEVARLNAHRLELDVEFRHGDLLDGSADCDAVLANLPYVAQGADLPPEVDRYEPVAALLAGRDGLDVIRRMAVELSGIPLVAVEIGAGQADAVHALLLEAGYGSVQRLRDLAGIERVLVGHR